MRANIGPVAASYSDSYSSDEDDVSPRERSQVCFKISIIYLP